MVQQQVATSTYSYPQIQGHYVQQKQQQTQQQTQLQNSQLQQAHATYYQQQQLQQQPSYTSIVQQGSAAWGQSKILQQAQGYGGVIVGQNHNNVVQAASTQQPSQYSQQQQLQYSQLQYSQYYQQQQAQAQGQGQGQQYTQHSTPNTSENSAGSGSGPKGTSNDVDGSATKKRHRSRFSSIPADAISSTPSAATATSSSASSRVQESYNNINNNSYTNKPSAATTVTASATATAESAKPANWPVSLKKFVDRSFALCKTDDDRKLVAQTLEKLINKVALDGRVTAHKWDLEDISSIIIPPLIVPKQSELEKKNQVDREREKEKERERERDRESKMMKMKTDLSIQSTSFRHNAPSSLNLGGKGGGGSMNGYNGGTYGANGKYGVSTDYNVQNGLNGVDFSTSSSPANSRYGFSSVEHSALPSPANSQNGGIFYHDGAKKRKNRWETDSNNNDDNVSVVSDSYYSVQSKDSSRQQNHYQQQQQQQQQHGGPNGKYKLQSSSTDKADSDAKKSLQNKKKKNEADGEESCRPLTTAEQAMRDKRASRFKEPEEETNEPQYVRYTALESQSHIQLGKKNKQKKRIIESDYYGSKIDNPYKNNYSSSSVNVSGELDFESLIVTGTCQKVEKDYFRLTSAPLPNTVRPEYILRQSLSLLKSKWDNNSVEYVYMCSQFKSMRQDLTVQHIQNGKKIYHYSFTSF